MNYVATVKMNMPFRNPLPLALAIMMRLFYVAIAHIWSQILDICYHVGVNGRYTLTADWRF